ncbi:MAG: cytidylate kinase family protein [Bryobacteraceae bacterium]
MGLIIVSGQAGCRYEEVARIAAQRLSFELVTDSHISGAIEREFGGTRISDRAWADVVASIVAQLATTRHLLVTADGVESMLKSFPGLLRVHVVAPDAVRIGNLMIDRRAERPIARQLLREMERDRKQLRKKRFGRATPSVDAFDITLNAERLTPEQLADLVESAARAAGVVERGFLSAAAEAQLQFQFRLRLSRHGIVPPANVSMHPKPFAHPSEEIFANLLDFYRIHWEYEPRSFPIQWNRDGEVAESFTPDFHLPEFDLYVELTTMKQSLVTRKNRKVKLLRELYPHIQIQVFYQKDIENLIFKYGLAERLVTA